MNRLASPLLCFTVGTLLPAFSHGDDNTPPVMSYTTPTSEFIQLDNGVVLEGSNLNSLDAHSSGFRLTAGFSPWHLPQIDIGAELAYRESDEAPLISHIAPQITDSLSLGGALVAGMRMGAFSIYAKSGLTEWRGEARQPTDDDGGTAMLQGFGATMTLNRLISRVEYERVDAPTLNHLNQLSASLHLPF